MRVLGLDGAKAGWVVVVLEDGHFVECFVVESFADDVVDAAAVAWTAHRLARGEARSLPDLPERDAAGRAVAIWC